MKIAGKMNEKKGFSLIEAIIAILIGGIVLAGITSFFMTQLFQYNYIIGVNDLSRDLRTISKYLEKDIKNALEVEVYENLTNANGGTNSISAGNALLIISEKGKTTGGKGVIYYRNMTSLTGKYGRTNDTVFPLIRREITFSGNIPNNTTFKEIELAEDVTGDFTGSTIFQRRGNRGIYIGIRLTRKGRRNTRSQVKSRFCFYTRNENISIL